MKFIFPSVGDMTDDNIDLLSTSSSTADASPVLLNETDTLRIKFYPILVKNSKDQQKSVSGKLIFERKKKSDISFPSDCSDQKEKLSRGNIKSGDWIELRLDTSETFNLYSGLTGLYELYGSIGKIPHGFTKYKKIDSEYEQVLSFLNSISNSADFFSDKSNYEIVKTLLNLISSSSFNEALKNSLSRLENDNLQNLNTSINVEKYQRTVKLMRDNLNNDNEEFWHNSIFVPNQWIISQLFACPFTIFESKGYVGGKSIGNSGGNICDFIYRNNLSQNIALIEIKTPCTDIIGGQYRGTYSISNELSGAINQVLNYRDKLSKEFYSISHNSSTQFRVLNPQCFVIIGTISSLNAEQLSAFENFRNTLNNIIIITFDELCCRIDSLLSVLSENETTSRVSTESDYPF